MGSGQCGVADHVAKEDDMNPLFFLKKKNLILLLFNILAENCMKMKEFGPKGGMHPNCVLGSTNEM